MALMFDRIARNFIKNGYYPTDAPTIERVLNAIRPSEKDGLIKILDNCCGEGTALAECQHYLQSFGETRVESYGVEYNKERATHAKKLLGTCIHGDLNDCMIGQRQFGLVWLNPPYGDLINDTDYLNREGGRKRMEKDFYRRTVPTIQHDGILVFVIPHTSLDRELSNWISKHFKDVKVFRAVEQQFKQVVIFGKRCKVTSADKNLRDMLMSIGNKDLIPDEIPGEWLDDQYVVPTTNESNNFKFFHVSIDPEQLAESLSSTSGLWDRFQMLFNKGIEENPRPLRKLSEGHLCMMLAAGHVAGVVSSPDGRKLVIKGTTYKSKVNKVESQIDGDSVKETRTSIDRFVPEIKAIDFTPGGENYGEIITIK